MKNNKIDIIIPAYKAHETIIRTLSSIIMQTIKDDLHVIIVNDKCPQGSYEDIMKHYETLGLSIEEVILEKNSGPGLARQAGIDKGENEFFTCIDADDTFASAIALETMRAGITEDPRIKCCSANFMQLGEDLKSMVAHPQDMVWMFGKIYRREFIEQYKIHFNDTRANEDTGFNKWVQLLCTNEREQLRFIQETVYFWHNKTDSITRINDGQYALDQCFCGWTDNMIYAIEHAKKVRPFDGAISQSICSIMIQLYFYWIETKVKKPIFADQNWEYVKKFYNRLYKKIEDDVTDEVLAELFSAVATEKYRSFSMMGVIPPMGIKEFLDKVKTEKYDPDEIYNVWERMKNDPEGAKLIKNNETCGVCPVGYTDRPSKSIESSIGSFIETDE